MDEEGLGAAHEADEAASLDEESLWPQSFVEWFVVLQTAIPAALFLPGSQSYRLPLRIAAYALPLVGFAIWWFQRGGARGTRHPADRWLTLALGYLALMIFHPQTAGLLAGLAQTLLYFSIFCSVFWGQAFVTRPRQLVRILAFLLVCNGINATVGVLQVYDPDRWMPRELSMAYTSNQNSLAAATYVGPNGRIITRPPGLFDTPGAVCGPGTMAALLGLIFALEPLVWWKRLGALGFAVAGVSAIYLSHVRANFIVMLGMMGIYAMVLAMQGQRRRLTGFATLCVGLVVVGLIGATVLGGDAIQNRFSTLLDEDPRQLYYTSRGMQLKMGFDQLAADYPFGAGLARWGMMRGYFGDPSRLDSTALWAEVQPNAWMLDGGLVLLGLYSLALIVTAKYEWRLATILVRREDRLLASTVAALNIGTLALVFSFVPFTTQVGLQYWFLEGALHGAMAMRLRQQT